MSNIMINELKQVPLEEQRMEICERKGLGHPDYICDAVMNEISVALSKEYLRRFGSIMHHNIDKGLLAAGEVETRFGGGKVIKPMLMVFGDRATFEIGGETVPVEEIATKTAKGWFKKNLRFVDPEEHVHYQVELKRGAASLIDIFRRRGKYLGANDTSAAVGFAPMTETERIVLDTEKFLNSKSFKREFPGSGEDVKIMGLRRDHELHLTIAMAFVDRFIDGEETYFRRKREILEEVEGFVRSRVDAKGVYLYLNTLDKRGRGLGGTYLTVLGTSADGSDCGQVGRGNRVNGIIPLNRPTSSEAAAGKNPVSHVGKIYNVLSYRMAEQVYENVSGIREVYVWLLSQIGVPINQPKITSVQLIPEPGTSIESVSRDVRDVIEAELDNLDKFCEDLVYGRIPVC
ncbi:MAG: methionine adenosyltransferase [Candidatus Geothermarchaeales archaeon]